MLERPSEIFRLFLFLHLYIGSYRYLARTLLCLQRDCISTLISHAMSYLTIRFFFRRTEVYLRGITKIRNGERFWQEFTNNLCLEVNKMRENFFLVQMSLKRSPCEKRSSINASQGISAFILHEVSVHPKIFLISLHNPMKTLT